MNKLQKLAIGMLFLIVLGFYIFNPNLQENIGAYNKQNESQHELNEESDKDIKNDPREVLGAETENPDSEQLNETDNSPPIHITKKIVENPEDILVLVNKEWVLTEDYVPSDLVVPNIPFSFDGDSPKKLMRREAAQALEELVAKALEDNIIFKGVSGYRSYQTQAAIFANNVRKNGEEEANKFSARPGESEHQTGLAMDISAPSVNYTLSTKLGETPEGKWLAENAPRFGFIIRYPQDKTHITGYIYEPWHIRYVGQAVAMEISEKGLTLEEYLDQ